ncbi:HEXXH motif-containing putative peptide modification protein [Nonomuraea angiospora]|uniref:aKG-HExxH-type peptide beta-hydroxylase n=1 Tax=Nonomuraea angiospora TaxID=46172 RepID=UPI003436739B
MTTETSVTTVPHVGEPFREVMGFAPDAAQHLRVTQEIVWLRLAQLRRLAGLLRRHEFPHASGAAALLERLPELPVAARTAVGREPVFHAAFTGLVTALRRGDRRSAARSLGRLLGTVLLPAAALLEQPVTLDAGPRGTVCFGALDTPLILSADLAGTPVEFRHAGDGALDWHASGARGVLWPSTAAREAVVFGGAADLLTPMLAELEQDPESFSIEAVRPVAPTAGSRSRFDDAMECLRTSLPRLHEEVVAAVSLVTPMTSRRTAAFTNTAFQGAVFLRDDLADPLFLLERLVHEAGHLRLNAFGTLVPLHEHAWDERVDSPFRTGPRPVTGLLHGAFVFTRAASALVDATRETPEATRGAAQARALTDKVSTALATLAASVRLTPAGRSLVAEIAAERDRVSGLCGDVAPAAESDYLKGEM